MWEMNYWVMGYTADVRLAAVSCLQIHLEIDFFLIHRPLLLLCQLKRPLSITWNPPHLERTMWFLSHFDLCVYVPTCVCRHVHFRCFLYVAGSDEQYSILCSQPLFLYPVGIYLLHFPTYEASCCRMEGATRRRSYISALICLGDRWPCKSHWHWGDIHLVYPYRRSPCPFMKTCAICHRVSPWLCSLINLSMWDGGDLLAQHLAGLEPRDSASGGKATARLLPATLRNVLSALRCAQKCTWKTASFYRFPAG